MIIIPSDDLVSPVVHARLSEIRQAGDDLIVSVLLKSSYFRAVARVVDDELILMCSGTTGINSDHMGSMFSIRDGNFHIGRQLYDRIIDKIGSSIDESEDKTEPYVYLL